MSQYTRKKELTLYIHLRYINIYYYYLIIAIFKSKYIFRVHFM